MIRLEHISNLRYSEKKVVTYSFHLNHEERDCFFDILKKYNKSKVKECVDDIEMYLDFSKRILSEPTRSDQVDRLNRQIKQFEIVYRHLLKISDGVNILPPRRCNFLLEWRQNPEDPRLTTNDRLRRNAKTILDQFKGLIEDLKSAREIEKLKRGQKAKPDEVGLAFEVAKTFKRFIGTPRPFSRPFPELIRYCFKIAEIKGHDRTRAIREALRMLSQHKPAKGT